MTFRLQEILNLDRDDPVPDGLSGGMSRPEATVIDKEALLSSLRECPQVASLEIGGESPTYACVETKNAEDASYVEALLHLQGWDVWESLRFTIRIPLD